MTTISDRFRAQQKVRENAFRLLRNDLPTFSKLSLKIRNKKGQIVPLAFNKPQHYTHKLLEEQKAEQGFIRAIIMKGRQEGISTYIGARFFQKTLLDPGTTTFILSHEAKSTDNLFGMTKRYHDHLPPGLSPGLDTSNKNQLKFSKTESEYTVGTAGNEDVGRSLTTRLLHMSEAAFYKHTDQLETGLMQSVADVPGTEIIIESTANGLGNFFHEKSMRALAGLGNYILIFNPWYWMDEYRISPPKGFSPDEEEQLLMKTYSLDLDQIYWRRMKIENTKGGLWKFQQEYPFTPEEAFLMSGETFFSKESIMNARRCKTTSPGAPRIGGMDCGRNNDRSVIGFRQGRELADYQVYKELRAEGREPTQQLIYIAAEYIKKHDLDVLFIDFGYGHGVIDGLKTLGFGKRVMGINFQQKTLNPIKYLNKRAEMYGTARDWLEEGETNIPDTDEFAFDLLLTPTEKETPTHRMFLPKKREIKKERKVSPDISDMFVLTFSFPVYKRRTDTDSARRSSVKVKQSPLTTINRMRRVK